MKFLKHIKWPGIAGALILALLLTNHGTFFRSALTDVITPPGVITPTSLVVTLDEVTTEEDINGVFRYTIFNTPASLDVVKNTGLPTNIFGSGGVTPVTHNGIRFLLKGTGTYSGVDPCTGLGATDKPIYLPDAVNNQLIERLQVRHPVTGLQAGATGEIDPIHVGSDPVSLKLIFPASNSVGCISDNPPSQVISGADTGMASPFALYVDTQNNEIYVSNNDSKSNSIDVFSRSDSENVSPQRKLQGPNTGLDTPGGIFVDKVNDEIVVANFGNDSISIYPRTWDPTVTDVAPIHVISGATTGIRGPGGVYEFNDGTNDDIYVTNGPDDSITVYSRPQPGDPVALNLSPKRIIKGPTTGLNTPCGIFVGDIVIDTTDPTHVGQGIAVLNNGNSSITFYNLFADSTNGDVSPLLTIKGDKTGISNACGLYVDKANKEVAVASAGFNSINFFGLYPNLGGDQNVYPMRRIMGANAQLVQPVGVSLDDANDAVAVANIGNNSITLYNRNDASPHLLHHPVFINPKVQQQLLVSYIYKGQILSSTGQPLVPTDPSTGQPYSNDPITNEPLTNVDPFTQERRPVPLAQGYAYVFKVYDPTMHSASDVNSAYLIPPSKMQFHLADGSAASNLMISCQVFTPFTTDELTTNCLSQSLIISPFPPQPVLFHIAATVIGKVQNKAFVPNIAPLGKSELPLVLPQVTLSSAGAILDIKWEYVNDSGQPLGLAPLITSQSFQMTYSKPYSEISACYKRRVNPVLAFSSGGLGPEVRSIADVKDTGCDIFLKDVANITFSTLDAYENRYAYSWDVVN